MRPLLRLRHFLGPILAGLVLLPLLQACGGRSDTEDYLFGSDGSGANGTGAVGTGASSSSGARPGDDPGQGANGSGAIGSGASGSGASGGAGSVGGKATGGTRPIGEGGVSAGGVATAGTGQGGSGVAGSPPGPSISCGGMTCDSKVEQCCAGFAGFGCIPKSDECVGAVLSCTNSDNCPGNTVCCLKVIEAEVGSGSQCKAACLGMGPQRERQLCQSDEECPFEHCRPTVFGVSVCTRR
jgi:hypothetical protein